MANCVWVAHCAEQQDYLVRLDFVEGMTVLQAIEQSQVARQAGLVAPLQIGIFSLKIEDPASHMLNIGDRVELYRPLKLNPKDVRRRRAEKNPVGRFQKGNRWNRQQKSTD